MQTPENDSDAFFWFGLVFSCLFVFFASESFSGVCITIHESDARSVSTVQKRERVKTANFLIQ
ncbi:hypothetical protein MU777_23155, partial [Salmonella enterica subsp. enterica serovar Enteritidis]|nr:hypothetical protein [Salmonella enterica subsp. enterica serovar Enteritidis]MCL9308728.1 hypothetical protein [Salmonella enterica subsp. enterica serovar Enteritidis]